MPRPSQNIENIKQAAQDIYGRLPALRQIVDSYLQVFILQEMFAADQKAPAGPPPERDGFRPDYDLQACRNLLLELGRLDFDGNQALTQSGAKVAASVTSGRLSARELFDTVIARDPAGLEKLAAGLDMDPALLGFWGYHGLRPTLVQAAADLADQADGRQAGQPSGTCPVCGAAPALAALEQDGSRRLYCSFCWSHWRIKRLACPFCEKDSGNAHHYFYDESLPGWRVDFCQGCRRYIKTVDLRKLPRFFYPPLENIASLPLDLKAEQENLHPASTGWMPGMFA